MAKESESELKVSQVSLSEQISRQEAQDAGPAPSQTHGEPATAAAVNEPISKKVSQKKLDANRRNAQLSTGPRTPKGKKNNARNSTTHGLLIKDVVIKTGAGQENEEEYETLLAEFRDAYKPVGIAGDLLVRELATSYWRTARALRCERGAVTVDCRTGPDQAPLDEDPLEILKDVEARHKLLGSSAA